MPDPHRPIPAHPSGQQSDGFGGDLAEGGKDDPAGARPNGSDGKRADWNRDIKAYYDAVASEPIPDEIERLMATLAKAIRD